MKYKVTFSQKITQNETNTTIVEADSEKEAKDKVIHLEYTELTSCDANVLKVEDFKIISAEEIEE